MASFAKQLTTPTPSECTTHTIPSTPLDMSLMISVRDPCGSIVDAFVIIVFLCFTNKKWIPD